MSRMSLPPDVALRAAEHDEATHIRDLVRAAYARWVPVIGREPMPMRADYDLALREHDCDVAVERAVIVGFLETMRREDHLWIENVAVAPDAQGRGLGRLLLAHAERKAAGAGLGEIRLLTNKAFADNVALYGRVGYRIDREEAFMNGVTVYMSKTLTR